MSLEFASAANRTILAHHHQRRVDEAIAESRYRSRFRNWDRVATVRNNPIRPLGNGGELFFTPELVPSLAHPVLVNADPRTREAVLVHRLYEYLKFTIDLEQSAVIPVTGHISRGMAGLDLPELMRADAFKIITDEAWHAQFTYELMCEVRTRTGIAPVLPTAPVFTEVLARIHEEFPSDVRGLDEMLFAIVSETLISSILDELPKDKRLPEGIRDTVADHADDEAKHHAYFSTLLRYLWPAMTRQEQELAGPYIPRLIFAFLEPDYPSVALGLAAAGLKTFTILSTEDSIYEIAIRNRGRGDRRDILSPRLFVGAAVTLTEPGGHFTAGQSVPFSHFLAAGVGINPILAVLERGQVRGWHLTYVDRGEREFPFLGRIRELAHAQGGHVSAVDTAVQGRPDWAEVMATIPAGAIIGACGPAAMISQLRTQVLARRTLVVDAPASTTENLPDAVEVVCARSGTRFRASQQLSLLEQLNKHGVAVPSSCGQGICGTCEVEVRSGRIDHRDEVLTAQEKADCSYMLPCVSKSISPQLVLNV